MIPVCYCGNKGIFHGIVLSALSVIEYTDESVDFYILTMEIPELNPRFLSITEEQAAALEYIVKKKNSRNSVRLIDTSDLYRKYFYHGKNDKSGYTPYSFLRLFLDLMDVPDKMLYLDADTMCCADIKQLYDIDIEKYEFAAVRDKVGHVFIRYSYCNAGVLLLNMPYIRRTGLFARARIRIKNKKMFMPDQTSINFLCESKLVLGYRFNEQRAIKPDTVIKHFCKGFVWIGPFFYLYNYKQWERDTVHKKLKTDVFDKIYAEYDAFDAELAITDGCK